MMTLEDVLYAICNDYPFDDNGDFTIKGRVAYAQLLIIVNGLYDIGAISESPDKIESYCDKIISMNF